MSDAESSQNEEHVVSMTDGKDAKRARTMCLEEQLLLELYEAVGEKPVLLEDHEEALQNFEEEIGKKLPEGYRAVLKYKNREYRFPLPDLDDDEGLSCQYNYNDVQKEDVYDGCDLIPFGIIDCDFCWRALDNVTDQILYVDLESKLYKAIASSLASYLQCLITLAKEFKAGKHEGEELWSVLSSAEDPNASEVRQELFSVFKRVRGISDDEDSAGDAGCDEEREEDGEDAEKDATEDAAGNDNDDAE
eukprot:TRINITY_DN64_c2_g2_i1.p1 TRINITY_DN64_c2_g2~~TRINITY_DN64_c2_g2_i1.p1  ORF type:complete len:248 (+),score=90.92 TRINITY_DN64_c2_g2_i1:84-827(+)